MIRDIQVKEWFYGNKNRKNMEIVRIFDVDYIRIKLDNNDDLFVTKYGLPFIDNLKPENYLNDKKWFKKYSKRLSGTSCLYKVRTKKIKGKNLDLVLKWNRMGQDVPAEGYSEEFSNAEFNSPFEEFSLVMELRNVVDNSSGEIMLQKPLAIYVPSEYVELWQSGRKEYLMMPKMQTHKEIELDINRSYAVLYEWIPGIDAVQAFRKKIIDEARMESLTLESEEEIEKKGFAVKDRKPHHVIIRPKKDGSLIKDRDGNVFRALVDFELLKRSSELEEQVRKERRTNYLRRQKDRFVEKSGDDFLKHLKSVNVLGVDYVYGRSESTKGLLWLVGRDPHLFDYFLPERWEKTPKIKISVFSDMFYTVTKDNIHIVWKVSRVGLHPDMDPFKEDEQRILEHGYNSPFEEVAIALELTRKGILTIYPRAIYATETKTAVSTGLSDDSRYMSHGGWKTPDDSQLLEKSRDYITIWGYWNGPDEKLAAKDGDYYEGIDALQAYRKGIVTQKEYIELLKTGKEKLLKVGIEDLNFRGNHLLLSLDNKGSLIKDEQGIPEIRISNFEFLKKL